MILPRTKSDLLLHPLVRLDQATQDFIGRYLEEFIEEIRFFVEQNNLDWVIREAGGKAYVIAERPAPSIS
jgi:hypothetical protein